MAVGVWRKRRCGNPGTQALAGIRGSRRQGELGWRGEGAMTQGYKGTWAVAPPPEAGEGVRGKGRF